MLTPWRWAHSMRLPVLTLDFKQTSRRWSWGGVLLLAIGALWAGQVIQTEYRLNTQIAEFEMRLSSLARRANIKPEQPLDSPALQLAIKQANDILTQLALPWNTLFQTLESNSEKDIALLSIQPDATKHLVRISGEARDLAALLAYINQLEHSRALDHVYLTSHEVRADDAQKPIDFALTAHWVERP